MSRNTGRAKLRREILMVGGATLLGGIVLVAAVLVSRQKTHVAFNFNFPLRSLLFRDHSAWEQRLLLHRRWADRHAVLLRDKAKPFTSVGGVSFSKDGRLLASTHRDEIARLWDVRQKKLLRYFKGAKAAALSSDGRTLATWLDDTIKLWDTRTGQVIRTLRGSGWLPFSPDSKTIAVQTYRLHVKTLKHGSMELVNNEVSRKINLWDIQTGRLQRLIEHKIWSHRSRVFSPAAFSPDGKTLAAVHSSHSRRGLTLWDVATGKLLWEAGSDWEGRISFSADGRSLAATDVKEGKVEWRDSRTGQLQRSLYVRGSTAAIMSPVVSPDDTLVASASQSVAGTRISGSLITLWNARTGQKQRTVPTHDGRVFPAAFSSDSRWLALAGQRSVIELWRVRP